MRLREKLYLTALSAGAVTTTAYAAIKFNDDLEEATWAVSRKKKTIACVKAAIGGFCYGASCVADGILVALTIAAWKQK